MIIANVLVNGLDKRNSIQVLCDSAQQVDCFAAYTDNDETTGNPTHANSATASVAGTTAVSLVSPPPKNIYKTIEYMSFKALIANTVNVTVRVQLYDNNAQTTTDLFSCQLSPGDNLTYIQNFGWAKTPASGSSPGTADLVTQLINELRNQFSSLGQNDILV